MCLLSSACVLTLQGCSHEAPQTAVATIADCRVRTFTNFSNELVLESYEIAEVTNHTALELSWQALFNQPSANYSVFVHALSDQGNILFQFDHKLVNASGNATSAWDRRIVKDVFLLTPPAAHPPGKYSLRLGLYVPQTSNFLQILGTDLKRPSDEWHGHSVLLPEVECR